VGLFSPSKKGVGIDLSSNKIKIVYWHKNKVVDFEIVNLSKETLVDGEIMDRAEIIEKFTVLQNSKKFKKFNDYVSVVIPPRGVFVKYLEILKEGNLEIDDIIRYEIENSIPISLDEVYLDYDKIYEDDEKVKLVFVAARKDTVIDFLSIFKELNFPIHSIDVIPISVYNVFEYNYPEWSESACCLFHIGMDFTHIIFVYRKVPVFVRDLPFGLHYIIREIEDRFVVPSEDAERILKEEYDRDEVKEVISNFSRSLKDHFDRSLGILPSEFGENMGRIFLSGEGNFIPGIYDYISEYFGFEAVKLDPFMRLDYNKKNADLLLNDTLLCPAIGSLLKEFLEMKK